jgi:hypothetical protein
MTNATPVENQKVVGRKLRTNANCRETHHKLWIRDRKAISSVDPLSVVSVSTPHVLRIQRLGGGNVVGPVDDCPTVGKQR